MRALNTESRINKFHQRLNYRPKPGSIKHLRQHDLVVSERFHPRKIAVRVRNFHFQPLSIECFFPKDVFIQKDQIEWKPTVPRDQQNNFKDAVKTALQALYLSDLPLGECTVQRETSSNYSVHSLKKLESKSLRDHEKQTINHVIYRYRSKSKPTYGADVECMIFNNRTQKWVSASSFLSRSDTFGFDDAIAVNGTKVTHPILELRPDPADSGGQLYDNILSHYEKLHTYLQQNHLHAAGGGNPHSRFYLGGHLHVGNQEMTFKHVRNLDTYLALPSAATESAQTAVRRKSLGRFGNVRENSFNGYEYRSLSSWYNKIPDSMPMLRWFQYITENTERFPSILWNHSLLKAYYEHDKPELCQQLKYIKECCRFSLPEHDFNRCASPYFQSIYDIISA